MKIFTSESVVDYSTYTFNYAIYCAKENREELPEIYSKGFLPYSNDISIKEEVFYLARSLRVDLSQFKETSENRRVLKKIAELKPKFEVIPKDQFNLIDEKFITYCFDFAKNRFSEPISEERLAYIFNNKSITNIFKFELTNNQKGYVITIIENGTLHYWFAFFDLENPQYSLGKYMMYSVINWAFQNNLKYVYLGTCYGEKSLYKVRDFKGLQFFDGSKWNDDMKLLKMKCKSDKEFLMDDFKKDSSKFLDND